jgi:hypothetical protein
VVLASERRERVRASNLAEEDEEERDERADDGAESNR